jgi:hypothetical protein
MDISNNFPEVERYGVSVSTIVAQTGDLGGFRVGVMPTGVWRDLVPANGRTRVSRFTKCLLIGKA